MAHLLPPLKTYLEDANGIPLAGGKVYSYAAGTSTPLVTYADASEATPNSNPVILDANGQAPIWIGASAYKFVVKDADDVQLFEVDQVTHLGNGSVTTVALADGSVTTDKLDDGAVTQEKLAAKEIRRVVLDIDPVSSTTPEVVSGTLTIATTGRPVFLSLFGQDDAGSPGLLKIKSPAATEAIGVIDLYRGIEKISSQKFGIKAESGDMVAAEFTSSGTFVPDRTAIYEIEACGGGGGGGGGAGSNGASGGDTTIAQSGNVILRAKGGGGGSPISAGTSYGALAGAPGAGAAHGGSGTAGSAAAASPASGLITPASGGLAGGTSSSGSGGGGGGSGRAAGGNGGNGNRNGGGQAVSSGGNAAANSGGGGGGSGGGDQTGGVAGQSGGGGGGSYYPTTRLLLTAGVTYDISVGDGGTGGNSNVGGIKCGDGGSGYLRILDPGADTAGDITAIIPPSAFSHVDKDAVEGTHNYTIQLSVSDSTATLEAEGIVTLQAYEL